MILGYDVLMTCLRTILRAFALSLAIVASASGTSMASQSIEELERSAEQGDASAQNNLGMRFATGDGVTRDDAEAVLWFRRSALQGSPYGQTSLGAMYFHGRGVTQDDDEAVRWYRLGFEGGATVAAFNLALMYEKGRGVRLDYITAYALYTIAIAQKGIESTASAEAAKRSSYFRSNLVKRMSDSQIEEAELLAIRCQNSGSDNCIDQAPVTASRPPDTSSQLEQNFVDDTPVLIGAGSSFTISQQGHLLTNQHVVDGCQIVTIHLPSGLKKALVVATDDTNDLALLKTDLEDDNFIPISGTNVSLLEDVIVAGYPLSGSLSTTVKVTKGVVSSLAGLGNDYSQIQIDAAIQPGNSGGPILNDQGNVVAVTVAALNKEYFLKEQGTIPENTNFGIKSSTARAFVDANGVKLPQPYSRAMSRRDMADLITKTTHLVGCWVSRATAQKMASDQKQELSVTPTMQRQVEALR